MAFPDHHVHSASAGPSERADAHHDHGHGHSASAAAAAGRPTTGRLPQTVENRIDAQPATRVLVREDAANPGGTIASCLTPASTPGPADIIIQNLDDACQPIAG